MKLRNLVVLGLIALSTAGFSQLGREFGLTGTRNSGGSGGGGAVTNLGGLQANLTPVSYYTNVRPFTNWAIAGGPRGYNLSAGGATTMDVAYTSGYIDANGELIGGAAINAITSVNVSIFTVPVGIANPANNPIVGPISATFQGTISTTTLTATSVSGTIQPYDTLTGPSVTGAATPSIIQPYGTSSTTGTGAAGTYALNVSSTVASASTMTTRTNWWTGLPMTVSWTGTGVTSVTQTGTLGSGSTALSCNLGANTCTFTLGYNPSNISVNFNFTAGAASPPTKILVYATANAGRMASCVSGTLANCFAPDWLAQIGPIGVKRYMDWMGTNRSGVTDISQLADFNSTAVAYNCSSGGTGTITIAGTTATVTGFTTIGSIYNKMALVDAGNNILAANTVFTSGTGGVSGSYTVSPSQTVSNVTFTGSTSGASATLNATAATGTPVVGMVLTGTNISSAGGGTTIIAVANLGGGSYTITMDRVSTGTVSGTVTAKPWFRAFAPVGATFATGAKCGVHPSVAVALANVTNTDVHYNLPVTLNDASMTTIAQYFFNNLKNGLHVIFEFGNENWNGGLGVTFPLLQNIGWSRFQNGTSQVQTGGYVSSHLFSIVNGVFGASRTRWRGMVGGQLVANVATPTAFVVGFNAWVSDTSSSSNLWSLFDDVQFAPYLTDTMTLSGTGTLYSMINDSVSCYNQITGAVLTGGSITGTTLTFTSASGTVLVGQGLTGVAGIPANTYITSGAALSWTLNNSVTGTVTGAMSTVPCATRYQWFAREYSKSLLTGSNEYSYAVAANLTALTTDFQLNALYANGQGLTFRNYEGGFQIFTSGSDALGLDFFFNWKSDPAGNDPLYTPAKVFDGLVAQQNAVWSAFPSIYTDDSVLGTFGQWAYPTDANSLQTEILAKNALGPFVDPTPAATWSVNYNSSTDHNFISASGSSAITCSYTAPTGGGLAIIAVSQGSVNTPTQVQIDSNPAITVPDAIDTIGSWRPTIWSQAVAAGSHTVTVTWSAGVPVKNCAVLTLQNVASNTVRSASTQGQHAQTINITKGSFIISVATPPATSGVNWQTTSTPSGQISGCPSACSNVTTFDYEVSGSQNYAFAYWAPGPPFNSAVFSIQNSNTNGMITAAYK